MNFKIRGVVGDITHPPEYFGQFAFVISIWDIDGIKKLDEFPAVGPYPTEEAADQALKNATGILADALQKGFSDGSGKIIDIKTGKALRSWGEM